MNSVELFDGILSSSLTKLHRAEFSFQQSHTKQNPRTANPRILYIRLLEPRVILLKFLIANPVNPLEVLRVQFAFKVLCVVLYAVYAYVGKVDVRLDPHAADRCKYPLLYCGPEVHFVCDILK